MELTKIKNSYVHELNAHQKEIDDCYNNKSKNVNDLKDLVRQIVMNTNSKSYDEKSVATKRFLLSLEKQRSKDDIITLVYNSKLNGDGLGVI